ncbi:unnamed protein product [Haemonchus placei]|uniref:EF-hand n=1 Tax=Haemonchus placei TaxID=6290 RepID=A0A0N4XAY9_HAEPC|nr:unnamed protein product [Haemonchus placei]
MMRFLLLAATTTIIYAAKDLSREPLENVNSFDSVDTDSNGAITYNEFEKWYKKTQHESSDVKIKNLFHKFDASRDQVLDVAEFVPLAYEISRKPVDTAEEIFKRMDLNHDNVIDTNEAAISRKEYGAGIIDSVLAVADVNGDGQLTYEEFKVQLDYNRPKSRKEANKEMAYKVLNYIDQNRDGKLSAQEIRNFSSLYNKLSDAEITQVISTLDVDKDGFLTVHELERIPGKIAEVANIQPPPTV